jgi:hypothetical protein
MNTFDGLLRHVTDLVDEFLVESKLVFAEDIGLDERAGKVYVGNDFIATSKYNCANLEYYGGFEYVDDDSKFTIGNYVFYTDNDSRVSGAIDHYTFSHSTDE